MTTCVHCGRPQTTAGDFCDHCGNYLNWAPSGEFEAIRRRQEAIGEQRVRGGDTLVATVGEVRLSLKPAEGDERPGRLAPRVVPGQAVEVVARIHNRTDRVDHFRVIVAGLPETWWTATPATVFLNPHGARGRHEQEVRIRLHPPRSPVAEARAWPLTVSVFSEDRQAEVATADVTLEIAPYEDLRAALRPARRAGRRRARFSVAITNTANAPAELTLDARDEEDACRIELGRPQLTVAPRETAVSPLTVRPTGRHWIGRPVDHRFDVTYARAGVAAEPARLHATFRRRPWLPWWLALLVPLAVAAAVAFVMLRPHPTRVPDLKGVRSPFQAQKLLSAAGLKLQPSPKPRVTANFPPGAIVDQDPQPGAKVEKGDVVTVEQAAGVQDRKVPNVVGMTPADADRTLRKQGLALGSVQPQPADLGSSIVTQLPPPDTVVKVGQTINVSVAPSTPPGPAVPVPVPSPAATPEPTPTPTPDPLPPTDGVLAYDDGTQLMIRDEQGVRPLLGEGQKGIEAAWSADGKHVFYVRDAGGRGEIVQVDPATGAGSAVVVTDKKGDYRRPAPSPAGGLLAYIDERNGKGRVCVQAADGAVHAPSCLKAPGWTFARRPAWSPSGQLLVVIGSKDGKTGLFGFRAKDAAASAKAGRWERIGDGLLAEMKNPNSVAWSPDGRALAVIADGGHGRHLWLVDAAADGTLAKPRPLQTLGCEVAWRMDGRLAVSQYNCGRQKAAAGPIVVVDPAAPASPAPLPEVVGVNPAWQPQAGTP